MIESLKQVFDAFRNATPKHVKELHTNDDVDSSKQAHHHTLGLGVHQAASGADLVQVIHDLGLVAADVSTILGELATIESAIADIDTRLTVFEDRPSVSMSQTVAQSIPNITDTVIDWDVINNPLVGSGLTASIAGNSITVNKDGRYRIFAQVAYAPNATGYRRCQIKLNGAPITSWAMDTNGVGGLATVPALTICDDFVNGDVLSVSGFQNSGAALNTSVATYNSFFSVEAL